MGAYRLRGQRNQAYSADRNGSEKANIEQQILGVLNVLDTNDLNHEKNW